MTRPRVDRLLLGGALVAIIGLLIWRVVDHGVLPIAPDDAEYIGVGRRLVVFQSPRGIDGTLFTIRSWVWPIMVGTASHLVPGDPFLGPKFLGVVMGAVALVGGVGFAFRRAGGVAALFTALAIGCTPLLWEVAASTRVDVALMTFLVLTIGLAAKPSPRRAVVAGAVAGITVLTKETSALLILLPLAWRGVIPVPDWRTSTRRYVIGFVAVVAWWFVIVFVLDGGIFPLAGLRQAAGRQVPRDWSLDAAALALLGVWLVGWGTLFVFDRRDLRVRTLALGAAAMVPAAMIALGKGFALRQFAPIALLSSIAVGIAGAVTIERVAARRNSRGNTGAGKPRALAAVGVGLVTVIAAVAIVRVHDHTVVAAAPPVDREVSEWLRSRAPRDAVIVSTFRFKAQVWARVGDRLEIRGLDFDQPTAVRSVAPLVWIDWRDGIFNALTRAKFARTCKGARLLMLSGSHRLGPAALAEWVRRDGAPLGFKTVAQFGTFGGSAWTDIDRIDSRACASPIPTLVTAEAVNHLSASALAALPPDVVIAGPLGPLDVATQRIAAQTNREVARLVAPAR